MTQQSQDSNSVNQNPKSALVTTMWYGLLQPRLAARRSSLTLADAVGGTGQAITSCEITPASEEEEWPLPQAGNIRWQNGKWSDDMQA